MKTAPVILTAGLLLIGGLAWAHMGADTHDGTTPQHGAAHDSKTADTHSASKGAMSGCDDMMDSGMMTHMMGQGMRMMRRPMPQRTQSGAQNDRSLFERLLQQRAQLGLSPEQVQQVQGIVSETRKALIRQEAEAQVAEIELEALMQADPVDLTKVEASVKRVESQRAAMRLSRLSAIAKSKALLTPDQRQKWSTSTAARPQSMPHNMGCPMMSGMMDHSSGT